MYTLHRVELITWFAAAVIIAALLTLLFTGRSESYRSERPEDKWALYFLVGILGVAGWLSALRWLR
jgi:hypothetical protein